MKKVIFLLFISYLSSVAIAQRIDMTINAGWRFQKGEIQLTPDNVSTDGWEKINVPHTWNTLDAFDEEPGYYRGVGWYAKALQVPASWEGKRVIVKFEGVNQKTEVYLNGRMIGSHIGGYTAFSFDVSAGLKYGQQNALLVKVDNSADANIPPLNADYTFYGGIYRNVKVIVSEPVHFELTNLASDGVFVETPSVSDQTATAIVRGAVVNDTPDKKKVVVETVITDKSNKVVASKTARMSLQPQSKSDFSLEGLEIVSPALWSPDRPYLYQASVRIREDNKAATVVDKINLPLGLRWFGFDDQTGFMLNGKALKLIGANRHQDFKGLANALPDSYHYNDYKKIKEQGFNFVRTAHYPQAPEVYRTCDELGLLVWSEIPVVSGITNSEEFFKNSLDMQREHIRQTRNHPSVVFYGYMNEIFLGFQYTRGLSEADRQKLITAIVDLAKQLEVLTKAEAPGRYTVMAAHHSDLYNDSGVADVADVMGWNLYFGWYYQNMEDLTTFLAEQHARYPKRPMIVSEYGPGTDIRIHAKDPKPWDYSEDYQYVMHASYLKQMMNMPYLAGFAAWNFADFGSERRGDAIPTVNQKGLVNFDRTEKDVLGLYRAYFSPEPIVHIASHNYTQRTGIEQSEGAGITTEIVKVFSNQQQIELTLNGKSLGKKQVVDHEVSFEVPFGEGKNVLTAADGNGQLDRVVVDYNLIPFLTNSRRVDELAVNVGAEVAFYDPGTKTMWMPDRKYSPNSWGYTGGAPYITKQRQVVTGIADNILGTDADPLFQTFLEGVTGYRFDVADGKYKLTLCFQEYISRNRQNNMYNLTNGDAKKEQPEVREFGIVINGKEVIGKLNLEQDYGSLTAVTFDFDIEAQNGSGVQVDFRPVTGKAVLSGIRVKLLD
jgi:beta-galactosidase